MGFIEKLRRHQAAAVPAAAATRAAPESVPSLNLWLPQGGTAGSLPALGSQPARPPAPPPPGLVAAQQRVDAAAERLRSCLRGLHAPSGAESVVIADAAAAAPANPFLPALVHCVHRLVRTTVEAVTQTRALQPATARRALIRRFLEVAVEWDANGFVDLQQTRSLTHGDVDPDVLYLRIILGSHAGQPLWGYFPFPLADQIMHALVDEPALLIAAAADLGAYYRRLAFGFTVPAMHFGRAGGDPAAAAALAAQRQRCEDRAALFAKVRTAARCDTAGFLALREHYHSGPYTNPEFMRDPLRTQVDLLANEIQLTVQQLAAAAPVQPASQICTAEK